MIHSQLKHTNVVELHEYTESDDEFVLFMQYCNDAEYFDNKIVEVSSRLNGLLHRVIMAYSC